MPVGDSFKTGPTITRTVTKHVVPFNSNNELVDPDVKHTQKHEEWTTSKKVVNHKTKQVETRIQRQLILEDGQVVADSGPQVTTKTKEDVRVEESENSEHKTSGDDTPGEGYELVPGSAKVINEKTESTKTMTETKEENRQMHDESMRDLNGQEYHQRIVVAPDETNFGEGLCNFPGTLTHYSSRSQRVVDQEDVKEVSELKNGEVSTETTRTHHHEEAVDDEVPEDEAEEGMVPERSAETSRNIQYYKDPKEFDQAVESLREESRRAHSRIHHDTHNSSFSRQPAIPAVSHKWTDDHYGKHSPIETARTKSGGNRITIEMTGHRSSPSDLSPTDSFREHNVSSLKQKFDTSTWGSRASRERSPSPPYISRIHPRSTSSPFDASSSSGSSRSKTPVKTFYLGEQNTYNNDSSSRRRRTNKGLSEILKSNHSHNGDSHYDYERLDRFYKASSTPQYHSNLSRNGTFSSGPIYSNVRRYNTSNGSKKLQTTFSDDDDDFDRFKTTRSYKERSLSPHRVLERSATTLPRNLKSNGHSKSLLIPISTPASKHYKSTDSLLSPNYSNYSSTMDYGSTNSFKYADHRSSPTYAYSTTSTLKNAKRNDSFNDSYRKNDSGRVINGYRKNRYPSSPPESGYQSPLPSSPAISPPPRLIKIQQTDHYGSTSSMSSPDSPHHVSSVRRSAAYPSGSTSRSKSSNDLRSSSFRIPSPSSFSPLSSPSELKTMGENRCGQTYYKVRPVDEGRPLVVHVRDWKDR